MTTRIIAALVLASTLGCGVYNWLRPPTVPDIIFVNASGDRVTLNDVWGDKNLLVAVFLIPGCSMTLTSLELLREPYAAYWDRVAFVGIVMGSKAQAEQMTNEPGIPFPAFGVRDSPDVLSVNDLIRAAGTSTCGRAQVYGGTVLVVNKQRKLVRSLVKEEVRELPKLLVKLAGAR
jgi:hypothetical protein